MPRAEIGKGLESEEHRSFPTNDRIEGREICQGKGSQNARYRVPLAMGGQKERVPLRFLRESVSFAPRQQTERPDRADYIESSRGRGRVRAGRFGTQYGRGGGQPTILILEL